MYRHVMIYSHEGELLGYGIKQDKGLKLHMTGIYTENEVPQLEKELARLNESANLSAYWPDSRDPEVQSILDDPKFMPLDMIEAEVVDDENSYYIYEKEPEYDQTGNPTGRMIDGEKLDEDASVIKFTKAMVPARPSDVMERTKKACELVAQQRASAV